MLVDEGGTYRCVDKQIASWPFPPTRTAISGKETRYFNFVL
ncbi:hypothetical protein SAMN04515648_3735 [Phyllobacterium sp. CL33Tsu]|nr:hypothetical protein SAMN04515648_3735 [Phyllobacterium sp. CL33Tsu]